MITAQEVHEWSDDQLRVKIAEALGAKWTIVKNKLWLDGEFYAKRSDDGIIDYDKYSYDCHNWPDDLTAAAELTKITQAAEVGIEVCDASYGDGHWEWECTLFDGIGVNCKTYKSSAITEPRARSEAWYLWWMESQS